MAEVKFSKDSKEFEMFRDYWKMVQALWEVENSDLYWMQTVELTNVFYEKYHTPYAKGLMNALLDELERIADEQRANSEGAARKCSDKSPLPC